MRIRKRFGSLGFSSISTTTTTIAQYSSDPPLISTRKLEEEEEKEKNGLNPSFGDENQPSDQVYGTSKTSSDLELTFVRGKNGWICCSDDGDNRGGGGGLVEQEEEEKNECMMNTNPTHKMEEMNKEFKGLKEEEEDEKMMMMIRSSSTTATKNRRISSSLGGEEEVTNFGSGVPTFSSNISSHEDLHQVLLHEMWCEGLLKGFPMKKRRGSNCERKVLLGDDDQEITRTTTKTTTEMIKQKKIIMKTSNPNKKWVLHEKDSQEITDSSTPSPKKNEEGSRCSRINGRGWRCCQQALVGYSLCEHHSCKGRLRNMNNVRNRSSTAAITADDDVAKPMKNLETRVSLMEEKCHEEEEKTSTTMMRIENKKRKKTGMVKARSISSLLGQTQAHDDYVKV